MITITTGEVLCFGFFHTADATVTIGAIRPHATPLPDPVFCMAVGGKPSVRIGDKEYLTATPEQ